MKATQVRITLVCAAISLISASTVSFVAAGTAHADDPTYNLPPAACADQIVIPQPQAPAQGPKLKREWFTSDGRTIMF